MSNPHWVNRPDAGYIHPLYHDDATVEDLIGTHSDRRWWAPCDRACIATLAILALATSPGGISGQEPSARSCPAEERIAAIRIENHDIFGPEEVAGGGAARWAYRLANTLHVRTRESFIRGELLFSEGDCLDPLLLEETGRILREYRFIGQAEVTVETDAAGAKTVVVRTQDRWTTQVNLGVSVDAGFQLERFDVIERNFLGRGILAGFFMKRRNEQRDAGGRLELPRLFGTRTDARFSGGRTRVGHFAEESVAYPFVGEVGRFAARQSYYRRDEPFQYSAADAGGFSHVLLPFLDERFEASAARRFGAPGRYTLLGFGVSRERVSFSRYPTEVEGVVDGAFGQTVGVPDSVSGALAGQLRTTSATRVNLLLGMRRIRWLRVEGLDNLAGDQDVRLGTELGLTVGKSAGILPADGVTPDADVYTRARGFFGANPGHSYVFLDLAGEGRRVLSAQGIDPGWHDVTAEADAYAYLRWKDGPGQTILLRASAAGGWTMAAPFQLTLGGRNGVRGFREEEFPGAARVILTAEDRILLPWPSTRSVALGLTLFADAGRMWAGDVPFGADSGWVGSAGFGLRMGLPAGSRASARFDLAYPLGPAANGGPVFRVTMRELLGVEPGVKDLQMERSRRMQVGPDFFTQEGR